MRLNEEGIKFLHNFESCRLKAYKALSSEKYWTIGWGHYGADVSPNMVITQEQADNLFKKDIVEYENAVNRLGLKLNQNQFNALTSFCYNLGAGCLATLVKNRSMNQIADAILLYNKSGGKVITGLTNRRKKERELFLKPTSDLPYKVKVTANALNIRKGAGVNNSILKTVKKGDILTVWAIQTLPDGSRWGKNGNEYFNLGYTEII